MDSIYLGAYADHIYGLKDGQITQEAKLKDASWVLNTGDGYLLAVSELTQALGELAAYRILEEGGLLETSRISTGGRAPCHIAYEAAHRYGVVSNYLTGNIKTFTLDETGMLHEMETLPLEKPGTAPGHAHSALFFGSGDHFFACDLGQDAVIVRSMTEEIRRLNLPKGSGPRHAVLSSNEKLLYVACELSCQMMVLDAETGQILSIHELRDQGYEGFAAASAIRLHTGGNVIAVSLRFNDKIIFFGLDHSGAIAWRKDHPVPPSVPREIAFSPDGEKLYVALQEGGRVLVYDVLAQGNLHLNHEILCSKVVSVCF